MSLAANERGRSIAFAGAHVSDRMTASSETIPRRRLAAGLPRAGRSGSCCRSALAVGWEMAVRLGWSNGRLVPPPSVIYDTFADLARTGELQPMPSQRCGGWPPALRAASRPAPLLGALAGYSGLLHRLVDPTLQALRVDSLDRVGAAVHSLVRHLRGLEGRS